MILGTDGVPQTVSVLHQYRAYIESVAKVIARYRTRRYKASYSPLQGILIIAKMAKQTITNTLVVQVEPDTWYCPRCNAMNDKGDSLCGCGASKP